MSVICPSCGKKCLDAPMSGQGRVMDAACPCGYNHRQGLTPDVMELKEFAAKVFGSLHKAEIWLNRPQDFTDGLSPIEYCTSKEKIELVTEKLTQIDHGHSA